MLKALTDRKRVLIVASCIAVLAGLARVIASTHGAESAIDRASATPLSPAGFTVLQGVTLTPAQSHISSDAQVSDAREAAELASSSMGASPLEVGFAHCQSPRWDPPVDCWVVSLDPTGFHSHGPLGAKIIQATYSIVLIDPQTGRLLLRRAGWGAPLPSKGS
jgi:hypothetical protein